VPALDESYVYCFQRTDLLEEIRQGFRREGLEDMHGRIVKDASDLERAMVREVGPRSEFKKAAENMVLPAFVIREGKDWRLVSYEADILSHVDWRLADVSPLYNLELSLEEKRDVELRAGLTEALGEFTRQSRDDFNSGEVKLDYSYAAAHLLDVVPNPWVGYAFVEDIFSKLLRKWKDKKAVVANNLVFILEEARKRLEQERDRLAEAVFNKMLGDDELRFMVVAKDLGMNRLPRKIEVPRSVVKATRLDGNQFELSLFDPVPADSMNTLEREVASFLDEQGQLYFWYRNMPHGGYYVQGWQKSKIYADFIFTTVGDGKSAYRKVYVLETKGRHLKNEDTRYKESVFALCNKHAEKRTWNELVPAMRDKEVRYDVVFQEEWEKRLNELLAE
jgi:type III restriction enzyme